jgi:hypothetical protein
MIEHKNPKVSSSQLNVKIPEIMEFSRKSDFLVLGLSDFITAEIIEAEGIYDVKISSSYSYLVTDSEGIAVPNFVFEHFPA